MSNLRYFMSKSLIRNNQNDKIKNRITDVILFFMVEGYVRISTADSKNSYLALLLALSKDHIFLSQYLKLKFKKKCDFIFLNKKAILSYDLF